MNKIIISTILFSLLLFGATSCGKSTTSTEQETAERMRRNKTPNPVTWDTLSAKKIEVLDVHGVNASASFGMQYIVPNSYADKKILESILAHINGIAMGDDPTYAKLSASEAMDKYGTTYFNNYKKEAKNQIASWNKINGTDIFSYAITIQTEVKYDEANLISYQVSNVEKNASDSLPITQVSNIIIDLVDGSRVGENDIFKEGSTEKLNQILVKQFLKKNKIENVEKAQEMGYWGIVDLAANNNFYITRDGITYTFNPEEYSDAKLGILNIFVDFDELGDVLKEGSPIYILAND